MGTHAFEGEPAHCALYRAYIGDPVPPLYGLQSGWNMPAARHRQSLAEGARFPGVDHCVLTYHLGGAAAQRMDGSRSWPSAKRGALSLQRPQSTGTFGSRGVLDYGHFYFRQSVLCEIAEEAGFSGVAEPEDFFALFDVAWARDAEAYLHRAADCADPPLAMEMDSRACIIGLGLLRTARNLRGSDLRLSEPAVSTDMRRVLREIDDRLAEPLRLSDLADVLGMSRFHFARVFKAAVGEAPAQYLMRRRTERAIEMLRSSDAPLAEVAFRHGFSSQSHMSRRIKAATGETPWAIRTQR